MEANGAMNYITNGRKKRQHTTEAGNDVTKACRMKFPTRIFLENFCAGEQIFVYV